MLVSDVSLCVVSNSKDYRDFQIKHCNSILLKHSQYEKILTDKIDFHLVNGFRTLVLSKQSCDNLKHYRVPKDIRLELLRTLPNRKDIIQVDDMTCYKYIKTDDKLIVCCLYTKTSRVSHSEVVYTFWFSIDLSDGNITTDNYDYMENRTIETKQELIDNFYNSFIVVLTYLELTDVKLSIVETKKRSSGIIGVNTLVNKSKKNVIHVNSDWNVEKIIVGTFGVCGHMRCQPYGVDRSKYKYIYIEPFTKKLIHRKPQKERLAS